MTSLSPFSGTPANIIATSTTIPTTTTTNHKAPTKNKPRKRVNTAEKRHQHNAIERQRRETLNGKFISLARLLPALANMRRPSKSAIVNGSITHLNYQRDQRLLAAKLLRQMSAQQDSLLAEVNEWRKSAGYAPKEAEPTWTDEMDEICAVEKETFGTFANVDGEDNIDDDTNEESSLEQGQAPAFGAQNTPRSSVEFDLAFGNLLPMAQPVSNGSTPGWSQDLIAESMTSSTASLSFNAFAPTAIEQTSSTSPASSAHGAMLTPPTTANMSLYTHTPSPRSSQSFGEDKAVPSNLAGWADQHLVFLQSQMQQPVPVPARHQSMPFIPAAFPGVYTSSDLNMFTQPQPQAPIPVSDAFTQSLLASMFPSQGVSVDQVEQWRKLALAGYGSQMDVSTARPAPPMRASSMWQGQNRAVEGF